MKVTEMMNTNPRTCTYSDTAQRAATVMKQHDIGFLPVVDDYGKVIGVITDRDLCLRVTAEGRFPAHLRVHEFMSKDPVCCFPTDSVRNVLALMARNQIRRIPIVDDQKRLVGIVTIRDFIVRDVITARDIRLVLRRIVASRQGEYRRRAKAAA